MGIIGDFFSGVADFVGGALSVVVDGLTGIGRAIGDGIKAICEKIGTEGMLLIGSIALSLIIPGFGIPEILTLIQIVGEVTKLLNIGGKDSPEELGMKSEIAERKPDDFNTTEEYIKYLNDEVKLDEDAVKNLSPEDKAKYGLMGSAIDIKAMHEKYNIELSPEFLRDVTIIKEAGKITFDEIGACVKEFADRGITKVQEMTDYLRGKPIENDKSTISSGLLDTMKSLYPEVSKDQLEEKLENWEDVLKDNKLE